MFILHEKSYLILISAFVLWVFVLFYGHDFLKMVSNYEY